jgi:hypothetical protein
LKEILANRILVNESNSSYEFKEKL